MNSASDFKRKAVENGMKTPFNKIRRGVFFPGKPLKPLLNIF
ncbi:hypothetical protein CLV32_0963 [Pedobacter duraquae]|uniref:Uncharacterized protein n=1 Tax=Pedobacter duraquae TaxID=425511 RepID=A0A4R6IQN8_9SPHI|nr:hypothetical protein CLV32_0963 [Pedobacter duraquae]